MSVAVFGDVIVHGNFAEVQEAKPENFDFMSDAKWLEDYPFDKREKIGNLVCSCKKVRVNYAPYYGFDYFHVEGCNLMKAVKIRPQLYNLWAYNHLPGMFPVDVDATDKRANLVLVDFRKSTKKIKVKVANNNLEIFGANR